MKGKKVLALSLAVVMAVATLVGCGSKGTEKTETTDKKEEVNTEEKIPIKISAINTVSWTPVFIAQTEGMFEEQGLEVEFTTPGGPKGFQAMHAGDCEFCMLSQEPLLIAQEQGMESKILGTMLKGRIYGFITTKDITDLSQLKGKNIYGSDPGSAPYTFTSTVLEKAGLDPLNDVTFIQVADQNAGMQALVNGEVDGAFVNVSNLPVIKDFEYNVLVDCTDPAQCEEYLGSSDFPGEMICTTKDYAEKNPEICQKVMNAIIDAAKWIGSHSDEEVAKSLSPEFGQIDEKVLCEEISIIREQITEDCKVSKEGQKAVIDMLVKSNVIEKEIPYDDVVDMTFVDAYSK